MRPLSEIARREEARCAASIREVADRSLSIAGGFAHLGPPKSWISTAVGLGLSGPVTKDELDRLIAFYASASQDARIELCEFAHPSLIRLIGEANFRITRFETVFFLELDGGGPRYEPKRPLPRQIEIHAVDRDDEPDARQLATVIAGAFTPDGHAPRSCDIEAFLRCHRLARTVAFAATTTESGRSAFVGGAYLEICGDLAALYGAGVRPEYRNLGIQSHLISARLTEAAGRRCAMATISGSPGQETERNVRRFKFHVAYSKAIMDRSLHGKYDVML